MYMLMLNKQSDYGLMILQQLSKAKEYTPLSQLIERTDLPPRFLARIAAVLVRHKLLISREGRVGGYILSPSIKDVSMYDYLCIFEKQLTFLKCLSSKKKCRYDSVCHHKNAVKTKLNDMFLTQLKRVTLKEILT